MQWLAPLPGFLSLGNLPKGLAFGSNAANYNDPTRPGISPQEATTPQFKNIESIS
jgi:hypothetical protein